MQQICRQRWLAYCRFSIVFVMLFVCAGNITNSMLLKWGFRDQQGSDYAHSYSLVGMMDGAAPRPFVYRASLAQAGKWLVGQLGEARQQKLYRSIMRHDSLRSAYFAGMPDAYWTPVVAITYHFVYAVIVLSTVLALFTIYRLARWHGLRFGEALGFLAAFSFVYPLTFQQGGYYYDFVELLGVFAACYFALTQRMLACTLVVALFSFNKETFFLVPCALWFLHDRDTPLARRVGWLVVQLALCAVSRHLIMRGYDANAGGIVEYHVWDNLRFWLSPASYFAFYNLIGKGIFTPSLQNPLMLIPLAVFFRAAWRASSARYRHYFLAAFLPVFALFVCFGYRDEARNFSVVFPAIVLIALHGATRFGEIFEGRAQPRTVQEG
jgi:hypothetical protein